MTPNGSLVPPEDIEAALRLGALAPSSDPRRTRSLRLVRACGVEPPLEWFFPVHVPAAWHLVACVLEVAPADTMVQCDEHGGGQHQDIVLWRPGDEAWPRLFITWTSGRLGTDNERRPMDRHYPSAFILKRAGLERAVRRRFIGSGPGASEQRLAAARLLARLTEPPSELELVPLTDSGPSQIWSLWDADQHPKERLRVDVGRGSVRLASGLELDAVSALDDLVPVDGVA